ncbi:MAG: class A beta-lactamase [Gammaproteobacteria bacterium]|nr:class A beta-lactamase [Gammaproteobacteria bacterium]
MITLRRIASFLALIFISLPSAAITANELNVKMSDIEKELNMTIGVAILDTSNGSSWSYKGNKRFPLMSTFKTLSCAKLLSDYDKGKVNLNKLARVNEEDIITYSPIIENYIGADISLFNACKATLETSDNTAANIILENIGGPEALTEFMRQLGDSVTRLDRIEPNLNEAKPGDIRDTTTPNAINDSLNKLLLGTVLSESSKLQLLEWMQANKVADVLLRAVLPNGWQIADRSGAGGFGSRGITAAVWSDQRSPLIISIYITQTDASFDKRNEVIREIGKEIFKIYQ